MTGLSAVEYTIVNVHGKGFVDATLVCKISDDLWLGRRVRVRLRNGEFAYPAICIG
jgi:hypothetical protein